MNNVVKTNTIKIVEIFTGILLAFYIISTTAFEGNPNTAKTASIALYAFLAVGCLNILIKGKIKLNYYIIAMWTYGLVLVFSYIFNSTPIAFQTIYWFFTCTIITTIVINYLENENKIHLVLKAYVLAGVILCVVAFGYYGLEIFENAANSIYGMRLGGEFGNVNGLGMACALSIIIALYFLVFQHNKLITKIFFISSIIICLSFALLTGSKKAFILILLGMLLLFFLKRGVTRSFLSRLGYMILGIVVMYAVYQIVQTVDAFWYVGQRMNEMFQTLLGNNASETDQTRLYMIKLGIAAFLEHPIFGNGVAYSYELFGTYSHNNYIEILINTGIIGFTAYYSAYLISFKRLLKDKDKVGLWVIMLTVVASISILEIGLVDYYSRYFQILLATVSAFVSLNQKIIIVWNNTK